MCEIFILRMTPDEMIAWINEHLGRRYSFPHRNGSTKIFNHDHHGGNFSAVVFALSAIQRLSTDLFKPGDPLMFCISFVDTENAAFIGNMWLNDLPMAEKSVAVIPGRSFA